MHFRTDMGGHQPNDAFAIGLGIALDEAVVDRYRVA